MSDMTPDQIEFQIRRAFAAIYPDNAMYPSTRIEYQTFDETIVVTVHAPERIVFQYDIASDDDGYFYFGLVMHDGSVSDLAVIRIPYPESV